MRTHRSSAALTLVLSLATMTHVASEQNAVTGTTAQPLVALATPQWKVGDHWDVDVEAQAYSGGTGSWTWIVTRWRYTVVRVDAETDGTNSSGGVPSTVIEIAMKDVPARWRLTFSRRPFALVEVKELGRSGVLRTRLSSYPGQSCVFEEGQVERSIIHDFPELPLIPRSRQLIHAENFVGGAGLVSKRRHTPDELLAGAKERSIPEVVTFEYGADGRAVARVEIQGEGISGLLAERTILEWRDGAPWWTYAELDANGAAEVRARLVE